MALKIIKHCQLCVLELSVVPILIMDFTFYHKTIESIEINDISTNWGKMARSTTFSVLTET